LNNACRNDLGESLRKLVLDIAQSLVDHPDDVDVTMHKEPMSTTLRLLVNTLDLGKVIGKQGRTARSIRTILGAASMKLQHRFQLDIVERSLDLKDVGQIDETA
jgi:predicted RNA-binding protein YlqC (UPF0109 family)